MISFIEVYKTKGGIERTYTTGLLPISFLESSLESTAIIGNLETIAIFKVTPKSK